MGTLADLKSRIATELARTDLTSQIANAVNDAIKFYGRERFWFNQSRTITFTTVNGQQAYGEADQSLIPSLIKIDDIYFTGTTKYPLDRYSPTDFEFLTGNNIANGKPYAYTYTDEQIFLYPTPNDAYTMRLYAHYWLPTLNDTDTNAWTDDAEELIRTHAKQLLYLDPLEDDQAAARMGVKIPELLAGLRSETSSRMGTGRIRPTQF
jgi:hypothetical protein